MFEWWGCLVYCCFLGTILGAAADHPVGWIFGLLIGFIIGTLPPVGPSLSFDPNDL
jgi:hypothetical protein